MKLSQIVLILSVLALVIIFISRRLRARSGVPEGQIIYADNEVLQTLPKPLYDPATGLVGKPDYILKGKGGELIPLEYKSSPAPASPYQTHIAQLIAYCRLIEVNYHVRPKYGLLRYQDKEFQVSYTRELEEGLQQTLAEIREAETSGCAPDRSHQIPARCRACGFNSVCDQSLAPEL
jgi:CRISPR-associated exonuclease Cas4